MQLPKQIFDDFWRWDHHVVTLQFEYGPPDVSFFFRKATYSLHILIFCYLEPLCNSDECI